VEVTVLMAILAQASASRHARPGKDQEKGVNKNNKRKSMKTDGIQEDRQYKICRDL